MGARMWCWAGVGLLGLWGAGGLGCQKEEAQTVSLTQTQWEEVKGNLLAQPPATMAHPVGAVFEGKVELLGVDLEPAAPKAGQEVKVTWYWKALTKMERNYQVFGHLDHQAGKATRQRLDHHPVRELYQTSRWEAGQIIRDVQTVQLRADYPGGEAVLWAGLWDEGTGQRLAISNADKVKRDNAQRVRVFSVQVDGKAPAPKAPPKVYVVRPLEGALVIDGKLDDEAWKKAAPSPRFGGTRGGEGPAGDATVKVLYDADHLYIGLQGTDKDVWGTLEARDSDTWTQEVFEVFVDPDGDAKDYLELQVTPRNTVFDARFAVKLGKGAGTREEQIQTARAWNSGMQTAVWVDGTLNDPKDEDKGWSVELKLPFSDVPGGAPKVGSAWKANFYRFDAPRDAEGKAGAQQAWSWTPAHGFFHNVEHFGTLRFVGQGASFEEPRTLPPAPADPAGGATPPRPSGIGEAPPDKPE